MVNQDITLCNLQVVFGGIYHPYLQHSTTTAVAAFPEFVSKMYHVWNWITGKIV
jgi:hypothetical protein